MISERTMRVLEFTRIREKLAEGALTEAGAEKCRALVPMDDLAPALAAQAETEEAAVILQYIGGHPMAAFPDVRPALGICEKGGTLSAGMLLNVAALLRRTGPDQGKTEPDDSFRLDAEIPAGSDYHHAGGPVCAAGTGGIPVERSRAGA